MSQRPRCGEPAKGRSGGEVLAPGRSTLAAAAGSSAESIFFVFFSFDFWMQFLLQILFFSQTSFSWDLDAKVFLQKISIILKLFCFKFFLSIFFLFSLFKYFSWKIFPNFFSLDLDAKNFLQIFSIYSENFLFQFFSFSLSKYFFWKILSQNDKNLL